MYAPSQAASPPALPKSSVRVPSVWAALGLIAAYFFLQIATGAFAALILAIKVLLKRIPGNAATIGAQVQATLQQPVVSALVVLLTLIVAAPLTLLYARRTWPALWTRAVPPGFGFTVRPPWHYFLLAVALGIAAPVLGGWLTEWLAGGRAVTQDVQQLGLRTPWMLRVPLALIAISLAPLVEELLFRGVLLSALIQRWNVGVAIAVSSLLFALVHLQGLGFLWYAVPDLALLAVGLAWLRLCSQSIWPSVLAHGVNNLLAVLGWFISMKALG